MTNRADIVNILERTAQIAAGIKSKLSYLIGIGAAATAYLAWLLYSVESALWWNVIKCSLVALPVLVWGFVWSVLAQLQEAPTLVAKLAQDDDGVFSDTQTISLSKPDGMSGLLSTLQAFRREDGLSVVFDTIGGVGLLANPIFALLAFVALVILLLLIFVALLVLIF